LLNHRALAGSDHGTTADQSQSGDRAAETAFQGSIA
jgi:hypothetical protein